MTDRQVALCARVEEHRALILNAERWIAAHPETGYQEWETSRYMAQQFSDLGYELTAPDNIPGFIADVDTGRPGPCIMVLAELDALICPGHLEETDGRAHACGHNAQCAALLGLAGALRAPDVLDGLCGRIRLTVVPAEETIQLDFRQSLKDQGVIHSFSGKVEFMHRGYFDGVDMAFMIHPGAKPEHDFYCCLGHNGFLLKTAEYTGRAAHAGGAPENGVNALYAANLGLSAINALRETFRDEDHIRVHPILTLGDAAVNVIPAYARIDTFIRGANIDSMEQASKKVNRALAGAALSMGASVTIHDRQGTAPTLNDPALMSAAKDVMTALAGADRVSFTNYWSRGSTDMGDVSCIVPAAHLYASGAVGTAHGTDFHIADPERACVNSAKAQLLLLDELLGRDAARAREIIRGYKPLFPSASEYIAAISRYDRDWSLCTDQAQDGSLCATLR